MVSIKLAPKFGVVAGIASFFFIQNWHYFCCYFLMKGESFMVLENKNGKRGRYQTIPTASKKELTRKRPAKTGLLKKFFAWIARGANQSAIGSTSCPT
jgi:hypothetical protein